MVLFFIGLIEMFIISLWTKVVSEAKVAISGAVTIVNVLIWYYVLQTVVNDINNWQLVLLYSLGCAFGTMIAIYCSKLLDQRKKNKKKIMLANAVSRITEEN